MSPEELVVEWLAGEHTMIEAVIEEPEVAWEAILALAKRKLSAEEELLLSVGPIESLIAWHGREFIGRIVQEAERNPTFNHLLGGVWRQDTPEEVWAQIVNVRKSVWD